MQCFLFQQIIRIAPICIFNVFFYGKYFHNKIIFYSFQRCKKTARISNTMHRLYFRIFRGCIPSFNYSMCILRLCVLRYPQRAPLRQNRASFTVSDSGHEWIVLLHKASCGRVELDAIYSQGSGRLHRPSPRAIHIEPHSGFLFQPFQREASGTQWSFVKETRSVKLFKPESNLRDRRSQT
jgi:hypothetical protein